MKHFFRDRPGPALWHSDSRTQGIRLSMLIAVPFLLGILLGSVVGLFSETFPPAFLPRSFFSETVADGTAGSILFHVTQYVLLAALCSACVFGVILLPYLAFLRGFFFAGAVSALYAAQHYAGLAQAALQLGLPALAGLTAFLLAACIGLRFSLRLLSSFSAGPGRTPMRQFRLRHLALILGLIFVEAAYSCLILPHLI